MPLRDEAQAACYQLVADARRRSTLPGIVAGVFSRAGVAWTDHVGAPGAQHRVGSITKTFTAVAVLQLRDDGALDLDDAVAVHVPDAPYPDATLRDLLAHRSGLTAEPTGPWWERSPGAPWSELADANRSAPRVLPPHSRHHYSNLGYALLGEVVARHRAMPWYDAVRVGLLEPLGLRQTTYLPLAGAAQGTSRDPRSGEFVEEPAFDSSAMAPAGQLWSTVSDLARWGSVLVDGSPGIVPPDLVTEMRTAHCADPDTQHTGGYGLGLRLRWRSNSTLVGHTGSMPGFLAALFADSVSGVGAVVLTNATTGLVPEDLAAALVDAVEPALGGPEALESAPVTPSPAAELAGEWYWGNTPLRVEPSSSGFRLHGPNGALAFVSAEADVYLGREGYFAGERLLVVRRPDRSLWYLEVVTFVLTRVPYDPEAPIPGGVPRRLSSPG
jgi:CubicO group peptidase (beta-lactamase class C family)